MKLYRVIPDQLANGVDVQAITEDALYRLGYISVSHHEPYFQMPPRMDRAFDEVTDNKGIAFFRNPWDAVMCSYWVNFDFYSKKLVRICEYDFPDETLAFSGEGLYKGYGIREVKIPFEELEKFGEVLQTPTPELADQIKEEKKNILLESVDKLRDIDSDYAEGISNYIERAYDSLHKYNMKGISFLMKSPVITGNMFTVTTNNRKWDSADIDYLVNNSCGILTRENGERWISVLEQPHKYQTKKVG